MSEHICLVCGRDGHVHDERCDCGSRHWPPVCCPGCPCWSFADAHKDIAIHEPDTSIYCLSTTKVVAKGHGDCGHGDYIQVESADTWGEFMCIHCGERIRVEVWD